MSMCSCAVHVNTSSKLSNFTDFHTLTHATRSYALLLQPIITVCLFTSDMFHSFYSAACMLVAHKLLLCLYTSPFYDLVFG